jgi:hypothetical protein
LQSLIQWIATPLIPRDRGKSGLGNREADRLNRFRNRDPSHALFLFGFIAFESSVLKSDISLQLIETNPGDSLQIEHFTASRGKMSV